MPFEGKCDRTVPYNTFDCKTVCNIGLVIYPERLLVVIPILAFFSLKIEQSRYLTLL
jgi:hypothetical protein